MALLGACAIPVIALYFILIYLYPSFILLLISIPRQHRYVEAIADATSSSECDSNYLKAYIRRAKAHEKNSQPIEASVWNLLDVWSTKYRIGFFDEVIVC